MSTKKLFGAFGKKSSNKKRAALSTSTSAPNTRYTQPDENDPVRIMQERMLHKALHNGNVALVQTAMPPMTVRSMSRERMNPPHTRVAPPRGTLCDDKLPYLDWRLSLIMLEQSRIEEKERQEYLYQQQQIHIHSQQSQIRSAATANHQMHHVNQNVTRRWSSMTTASTSDSMTASGSGSEISSRKHSDSVNRHDQTIDSQGWQHLGLGRAGGDADREAKVALQRAIATDIALADVPRLSKGKHQIVPTKPEDAQIDEEEDSMSSARSSTSMDEFHDAEDGGEAWAEVWDQPASTSMDSYFTRALNLGGSGLKQKSIAKTSRALMS